MWLYNIIDHLTHFLYQSLGYYFIVFSLNVKLELFIGLHLKINSQIK